MRAICESCGLPQPVDWKPGDLCVHCGQTVRREVRCFWCVKLTPSAKYCRTCGAAVVEPRLFGAARMLKDAGVDRFVVPKMLVELDPDQIENFTNIYQRHAAVLNRHVDHVRFLESFLRDKNWSSVLEEDLLPQLPWPEERLKSLAPPVDPAERNVARQRSTEESLALARAISAMTPFSLTRSLALLVRALLQDWEVLREATGLAYSGDPLLAGEAALALTHWRVYYAPGIYFESDARYRFIDALRACPLKLPAGVQLAMIGDKETELPSEALVSDDPDIAFSAALAAADVDRLVAAERDRDPAKRHAAAWRLIRLGTFDGVSEVMRTAAPAYQLDLLGQISLNKKAAPVPLRDVLLELLETGGDANIRDGATSALLRCWQPGDTMRIARAARGNSRIYQALLQTAAIEPQELAAFCEFLLDNGAFTADQWGMSDAAKQGRVPANFIPRLWANAAEAARVEMLRFAEMQLEQYGDEDLHRFLVNVVFGNESFEVQKQAWTSLYRWYGRSDHTRMGPLRIEVESLNRFFGSPSAFIPILTRFLGDGSPRPVLQEMFVHEPLAKFLRYAETDVVPHFARESRPALALARALQAVMRHAEYDLILRLACIDLLVLMASARALRQDVIEILNSFSGSDLDHGAAMGLERIHR